MLTDIVLKFLLKGTEELSGDMIGFTTDMPSFYSDIHLMIGNIELDVEGVSYDIISRRQIIEAVVSCLDDEDARELRDDITGSLMDANFSVFDIEEDDDHGPDYRFSSVLDDE